jgi:hypothetical protein
MKHYRLSEKGKTWFDGKGNYITLEPIEGHVLTEEELREDRLNFHVWATKRASTYAFGSDILEVLYSDYQQHLKDKEDES